MRKLRFLALPFILIALILTYQNCGPDLGDLDENVNSSEDVSAFPLEYSADTLAHMSCQGNSASFGTFFTFKLLTTDEPHSNFYIHRSYASLSKLEQEELINESSKLKNSVLHFSLRDGVSTQNPIVFPNNEGMTERLVDVSLGDSNMAFNVAYFDNYPLNMEAVLDFRIDNGAVNYQEEMSLGSYVLHLGIKDISTNEEGILGPKGDKASLHAYGNSYEVIFQQVGQGDGKEPEPNKSMNQVRESILVNGDDSNLTLRENSWTCERYMIVKAGHQGGDGCTSDPSEYQNITSSSSDSEIKKLYKVLGPGWEFARHSSGPKCVKHSSRRGCYVSSNIHYNTATDCGSKECPHFLSVCTKDRFDNGY